ncbi:MAG: hypothetical protein M3Z46_00125 [Actinomycetota bacterium]|nr:hypothetical protein [Actinomycetota bacterium]
MGDPTSFGVVVTEVVVDPWSRFAVVVEGAADPPVGVNVDGEAAACRRAVGPADATGDATAPVVTTAHKTARTKLAQ